MSTPLAESEGPPERAVRPWSARRIILVIVGSLVAVIGVMLLIGGGAVLWAEQQRDADGYFSSTTESLTTDSYGLAAPDIEIHSTGPDVFYEQDLLGEVRIEATAADSGSALFVGIGPTSQVDRYLAGVGHDEISEVQFDPFEVEYDPQPGGAPAAAPTTQTFWAGSESGTGSQTLVWDVSSGDWTVVIMNADGSPGFQADVSVGATVPILRPVAIGLLIVGGILLVIGTAIIVATVATRARMPEART